MALIKVTDIAYVRLRSPDLDVQSEFLENFGLAPSVKTAQDGTYQPLSRPLFIYVKKDALQRPEMEAFLRYILDNETAIAEASQFVPLTDEQLTKAQADLESALG